MSRNDDADRPLPLGQHLDELRARILLCLVAVAVTFVGAWIFREPLLTFLMQPHLAAMQSFNLPVRLHALGYTEPFFGYMKICFIAALFVSSPFILYQLWRFVGVALHRKERGWVMRFLPISVLLFLGGMGFCYFVLLPLGLQFLVGMGGRWIEQTITLSSYLSLVLFLSFAMGLVFELPLVMYFLGRIGIATGEGFRRARKFAIVLIVLIAAVVTPTPDPFTQVAVAMPMVVLYEVGILLVDPNRRNLRNVVLLFAVLALTPVGGYAYSQYRAGHAGALVEGTGTVEYKHVSSPAQRDKPIPLGATCQTNADSTLTVALGRIRIQLNRNTRICLTRHEAVDLLAGEIWARCGRKNTLTITTAAAQFSVQNAEADIAISGDSASTTAVQGEIGFSSEGRQGRITAGQRRRFTAGSEAVDVRQITDWTNPDAPRGRNGASGTDPSGTTTQRNPE